jgi:hypothetical protein
MSRYLRNRWVRTSIALFALGTVPLAGLALLVSIGLWSPAVLALPSLLWMITFWPAVFFLAAGIVQVRGER